jgi:hypothetical protein
MKRVLSAALVSTAMVSATGCTDATGSIQGGDPQFAPQQREGSEGGTTWTSLYTDLFGPSGLASCNGPGCHALSSDFGAMYSGFVCGSSKDACWQGLTQGSVSEAGTLIPILPPDAGDITSTTFWLSLHKEGGAPVFNNMPCGQPTSCPAPLSLYEFTSGDLQRISEWYKQGALDN